MAWETRATKKKVRDFFEFGECHTSANAHRQFDPFGSFRMLFYPDIACMLLFTSMIYSIFYMVLTTYSTYLTDYYGYDDLQVGLLYL